MPKICELPTSQKEWRAISHKLRKARRDIPDRVGITLTAGDGRRYIHATFKATPLGVFTDSYRGPWYLNYASHARRLYQSGRGRSYASDCRSWIAAARRERLKFTR